MACEWSRDVISLRIGHGWSRAGRGGESGVCPSLCRRPERRRPAGHERRSRRSERAHRRRRERQRLSDRASRVLCRRCICRCRRDDFRGSSFSVTAKLTAPRALVERNIADAIGRAAPDLDIHVPRLQRSAARDGDSGAAGRADVRLLWRAGDAARRAGRLRRHRVLGRPAAGGDCGSHGARREPPWRRAARARRVSPR